MKLSQLKKIIKESIKAEIKNKLQEDENIEEAVGACKCGNGHVPPKGCKHQCYKCCSGKGGVMISKRNENKSLNEASLHDCMISQLQSYVASNPPTEFSFEEQADYYRGAMNYALNACKDNVYIAKDTQTKNFG